MSTFDRLLTSRPINRQALRVTAGGAADQPDLSPAELVEIMARLMRKQRLLKLVLGVKNQSQHRNLMYKHRHSLPQYRQHIEPRSFIEYVRLGREIDRMNRALAEIKRTAPPKRTTEEQLKHDRWWASLTPEQQQAHKQTAYDAKMAMRAKKSPAP